MVMSEEKKKVDVHWQTLPEKIAISLQWIVAGLIAGLIIIIPLWIVGGLLAIVIFEL